MNGSGPVIIWQSWSIRRDKNSAREMQTSAMTEFPCEGHIRTEDLSTCGRCVISSTPSPSCLRDQQADALKVPIIPSCTHRRQRSAVLIKIAILSDTQHSCEIRETCTYNAAQGNQFLLGSTPFQPCECKLEKTTHWQTYDSKPVSVWERKFCVPSCELLSQHSGG